MTMTFRPERVIRTLYRRFGSWRKLSDEVGISARTLCTVAHGRRRLDRHAENALRRWLFMPPRRCRSLWQMRVEDLRWFIENRRVIDQ